MAERKIEVTYRTSTSFTFKVTGLDPTYTANDRQYVVYIDDVQDSDRLDLAGGVTETPEYTKTGLTPNTVYSIKVNISYSSGFVSVTHDTKTLQEGEEPTPSGKITPWSWYESNKDATAEQTQKSYEALLYHGSIDDFSHKVWNDLCYKFREVVLDQELGISVFEDDRRFTNRLLMNADYKGDGTNITSKYMTATRYNELISALDLGYYTSLTQVSKGDIITSDHFLVLVSDLNSWINLINSFS